jgi:hypothetical protein
MKLRSLILYTIAFGISIVANTFSQTTYNIYFGDNHSHTWYSDGGEDQDTATYNVPVARSITWAKNHRSSFDFLGVSDHNHHDGGPRMTLAYWRSGIREADSVNQNGNFVGLHGQEWGTISGGGHVLVYGTDNLYGWNTGIYDVYVAKGDYSGLFTAVNNDGGYCYLAHPQSTDFDSIFIRSYNARWDSVIHGIAMKSGKAESQDTAETDPETGNYESRFHDLLKKGYHVAPIANQDNHYTTFGRSSQQRTGVLATSLTKANVDEAFRNRRVYATEDHNLQVRLEVGSHAMGEIVNINGTTVPIRVKVIDPDGESITSIVLRYGVAGSGSAPTTLTSVSNQDSLVRSQTQAIGTTYYYYAYIVEADGHKAWSAPVWVTTTTSSAPGSFNILSPSNASTNQTISGTLSWSLSTNATGYDVYLGTANPPVTKVSSNQAALTYSYSGLSNNTVYYWKIVARNAADTILATGSPWSFTTINNVEPIITVTGVLNDFGSIDVGDSSSEQSYTVTGTNLTADINITAPTGFAISASNGSGLGSIVTLTQSGGMVPSTTIYVRFIPVAGGATSGTITNTSNGATTQNVSVNGTGNQTTIQYEVISRWNFEGITTSNTGTDAIVSSGSIVADSGMLTSGSAFSGHHSSSSTVWSNSSGNGSTKSVSSNYWAVGDYYQFLFSTVGYRQILITWDQIGSNTGPKDFKIRYSTDGTTFADAAAGSYSITNDGWSSSYNAVSRRTLDLSSITTLNNQATVYIRVVDNSTTSINGGTVGTGGTGRIDNFIAQAIPSVLPTGFTLSSPSNGATGRGISGTLSWSSSTNATGYDLFLGTTNPPMTKVSSNQASTSYSYNTLLYNTTYFWKVVAKNSIDSIPASGSPWSFTTIIAPPVAFSMTSPANGESGQPVSGTLTWEPSTDAAGYDVYLGTTDPPKTKISSDQVGTSYSYSDLSYTTTYYWKVVAKNSSTDTAIASGSPWSFATVSAPSSEFSLLSPISGSTGLASCGTLRWTTLTSAISYDVFLGTDNPPITKVDSNRIDTSYEYSNLIPGSTYYWFVVAKDSSGSISANNTPWHFTITARPYAPSSVMISKRSVSSLEIHWNDNAINELGYRIYRSSTEEGVFTLVGGDLEPNTISFTDSMLDVNQRYYYRVVPFNGSGEGAFASIAVATLANIPGAPFLTGKELHTCTITLDSNQNPDPTQFAIMATNATTTGYIQADGTVGIDPVWRTFSQWGGSSGISVSGLSACQMYTISVRARNLDTFETSDGNSAVAAMLCNEVLLSVNEGWNLISVPVNVIDARTSTLFPTVESAAFAYSSSYVAADAMENGNGYWLKFKSEEYISILGDYSVMDTIQLAKGWNIIGSISTPVDIDAITTDPPGIIISDYYAYANGYSIADTIYPAKGYWVKSSSDGNLILSTTSVLGRTSSVDPKEVVLGSILFETVNGGKQKLYFRDDLQNENSGSWLPPLPPEGCFDVRFASQKSAEYISTNEHHHEYPINLQSREPVNVSVDLPQWLSGYLYVNIGDQIYTLSQSSVITINPGVHILTLTLSDGIAASDPTEYALCQNYPNPFNPTTTIRYEIPRNSYVTLSVFNTLGEEVAMLVDGKQDAGYHEITFNADKLTSGIYFYCLHAGSFSKTMKLVLLK